MYQTGRFDGEVIGHRARVTGLSANAEVTIARSVVDRSVKPSAVAG